MWMNVEDTLNIYMYWINYCFFVKNLIYSRLGYPTLFLFYLFHNISYWHWHWQLTSQVQQLTCRHYLRIFFSPIVYPRTYSLLTNQNLKHSISFLNSLFIILPIPNVCTSVGNNQDCEAMSISFKLYHVENNIFF